MRTSACARPHTKFIEGARGAGAWKRQRGGLSGTAAVQSPKGTARPPHPQGAARPQPSDAEGILPPLPQRGDRLTEDQMSERFGVRKGGGVRESSTSSDIILVGSAHGGRGGAGDGWRVVCDGVYYKGQPDQLILANQRLARSQESGSRVLYFVKEGESLVFDGLVECVARRCKDAPARPGALTFELRRVGVDAAAAAAGRQGGRRGPPGSRAPSAPDLDMITEVERQISDRGSFADRTELLAALPTGIDPAKLDRILEYLGRSAKISVRGEAIRWAFSGGDAKESANAGTEGSGSPGAAAAAEEPVHILSMAERLSPDLDNDLPYSPEIERAIADCEAGRPIGKTYTVKEYLRELDQEFGNDAAGRSTDWASQGQSSALQGRQGSF